MMHKISFIVPIITACHVVILTSMWAAHYHAFSTYPKFFTGVDLDGVGVVDVTYFLMVRLPPGSML